MVVQSRPHVTSSTRARARLSQERRASWDVDGATGPAAALPRPPEPSASVDCPMGMDLRRQGYAWLVTGRAILVSALPRPPVPRARDSRARQYVHRAGARRPEGEARCQT